MAATTRGGRAGKIYSQAAKIEVITQKILEMNSRGDTEPTIDGTGCNIDIVVDSINRLVLILNLYSGQYPCFLIINFY